MTIKVIDNFLNEEEFLTIKNTIFHKYFPWYLTRGITFEYEIDNKSFYMSHILYEKTICSSFYSGFEKLIEKINPNALVRIKANFYPRTDKLIEHKDHKDYEYNHKGALFSINTCDGFTIIGNEKIKSVENRILFFDPSKDHHSTTCTDDFARININFNYF